MRTIFETPVASRQLDRLLDAESYRMLQLAPGAAGRRSRHPAWRGASKDSVASERFGKSSGVRVIYYLIREDRIYILHAYAKGELEDLTQSQLKELRSLLDE